MVGGIISSSIGWPPSKSILLRQVEGGGGPLGHALVPFGVAFTLNCGVFGRAPAGFGLEMGRPRSGPAGFARARFGPFRGGLYA